MRRTLSLKSKLVLVLLLVSLISVLVIGLLGWWNSRATLTSTISTQLVTVRRAKADQIEAYFGTLRAQVETLSQDDMLVQAMVQFNKTFKALQNKQVAVAQDKALETYYTTQFFPKLFANFPGQADYTLYRPDNQAGLYLQYYYIAANPHTKDAEKGLLDQATDDSEYSKVHAYYQPRLRNLIQKFGYYDLILVNFETGDVVYTVEKQTDFGSNLDHGPYNKSNEARVVDLVRANADRGSTQLVDFELYRPSYGAPGAFWAAPLYNGSHIVGILLLQISLAPINKIMTYNQDWVHAGLGKTGEAYLVGPDLLMRSDSRFLVEDPKAYGVTLGANGVPDRTVQLITKLNTTILLQKLSSVAAIEATQGHEGTLLANDYRGVPSLIAYQPLTLDGLQWGLVVKMSQAEVFAPIYNFQNYLLIATVLMMLLCTFSAILIANFFMRPVNVLTESARKVGAGQYDVQINLKTGDELGELATTFNDMVQGIRQQTNILEQKNREIERLLLNLLPSAAARRVQNGETRIVDQVQQVTVLYASVMGFQELAKQKEAEEIADILQDMTIDLDEAGERYDIEKLAAVGQRFIGVCGLSTPHLDHSRRSADFALAALRIVQRVNKKYNINLNLRMGIHAGALMAGVIGVNKIIYEMWGETVNIASYLNEDAGPNTILASQEIYERLHEQYMFRRHREAQRDQPRPVAWALEGMVNAGEPQPVRAPENPEAKLSTGLPPTPAKAR